MAETKRLDERKLLGLPTGWERPTGKQLVELANEAGYGLRKNASRDSAIDAIATGSFGQRIALQKLVRAAMGVPEGTPAKGAKKAKELTVADMREAIQRKHYSPVPKAKAKVQPLYEAIVGEGRIPHSYPTGTVLQRQLEGAPWTMLRVTPEQGQPTEQVALEANSKQGAKVAGDNIACKANRLGMLVELGEVKPIGGDTYKAVVTIVPADAS